MTRPNRHDAPWSSSVERCLGLVHTATPYFPSYRGTTTRKAQLSCARPITSSLEPRVRILHRPCRPLLRGLEQAHRAALDDHVHRPTRLGQWVLISGSWYHSPKLAAWPPARRGCRPTEDTADMHVCKSSTPTAASTVCASAPARAAAAEFGRRAHHAPTAESSISPQKGLALSAEEGVAVVARPVEPRRET